MIFSRLKESGKIQGENEGGNYALISMTFGLLWVINNIYVFVNVSNEYHLATRQIAFYMYMNDIHDLISWL